ncbi:MAG: sugar transferase [Ignavibacteria bacterium]|jgi:O-antigen biosynthesis protein WbqP
MRFLEILSSVILLLVIAPFLLVISIILLLQLKRIPIYIQKRAITLESKIFTIYKLRTLKENTSNREDILNKNNLVDLTTKFTRWLRKTGMDEVPQLINVIKGDMGLIGPRPLMLEDLEILKKDYPYYYSIRNEIKSKPGITGMWQIFGDRTEGIKNLVALDIYYELNKSAKLNWEILLLTIFIFLTARNSDAILDYSHSYKIKFINPIIAKRLMLVKGTNSNQKLDTNSYKVSA